MRCLWMSVLILWASPMAAQDYEDGKAAFTTHCAACHGSEALGNGPMAALLRIAPPNLTELARANGGAFPLARVISRIDGTTEVMAHGGAMPLFGLIMDGPSRAIEAPDGREIIAPEMIVGIAAWLATQQR